MKRARDRVPFLVWIALVLAIPILVLVALAMLMERTPDARVADSPPTENASPRESSPTTLVAKEDSPSRVAVPPSAHTRRPSAAPVPQQPSITPRPPAAFAPGTITIIGQIRDTSGNAIETEVGGIGYRNANGTRETQIHGSTFRLENLEAGPAVLQCVTHGYRRQLRKILLRSGETEHREDFILDPDWSVDVQLVTAGDFKLDRASAKEFLPDGQFHFGVSESAPPERWIAGSVDAHRARRLVAETFETPVAPGSFVRLRLLRDPPLVLSVDVRGVVLASTRLDSRVDHASLVLPIDRISSLRSSFTCVVLDRETGAPFPIVHATLSSLFSSNGIYEPVTIETDRAGRLERGNLLPGRYTLSLRGEGPAAGAWSARTFRTFDLEPGRETDLGMIALDASQHVRGRFLDEEGRPVAAGGSLRPLSMDDSVEMNSDMSGMRLTEEPSGGFERDGLAKERYALVVWGRPWGNPKGDLRGASVLVDLREGSIDDLVVRLDTAFPVRLHAGTEEAQDFVYRIADANGVPLFHGQLQQPRSHWIAPGNYVALVGPDTDHLREIPFTHGTEGQTIEVEP